MDLLHFVQQILCFWHELLDLLYFVQQISMDSLISADIRKSVVQSAFSSENSGFLAGFCCMKCCSLYFAEHPLS
ncbi:hypothetical protein C2I18_20995 [Paenibacillus sp. PK3_47]|uniref:hypothetical protein n=1 Tax=Paenibacillus sp. PK3_47 TaxID=2072642 RepID=UPI00201D861F|nr:hypothetical protein [Paenibacillus sp. PK3_47]UQZ35786.1 hypothetical protein C2I18_20995 [Paenibacillus sp. PK3_47]